jgi:hypothetical protein
MFRVYPMKRRQDKRKEEGRDFHKNHAGQVRNSGYTASIIPEHRSAMAMQPLMRGQRCWLSTGALALLLGGICFPSLAQGSCGHYVLTHQTPAAAPPGETISPLGGAANTWSHPAPMKPPPCTGPQCTRHHGHSPPVTVPQVSPDSKPQVSLIRSTLPEWPHLLVCTLFEPDSQRPMRRTTPIYHPPRELAV